MREELRRITCRTAVVFLAALLFCLLVSIYIQLNRNEMERLNMEKLVAEKKAQITETVYKLVYRVQTLSSFIRQYNGNLKNFKAVASILVDDPTILNILAAPGGVVSHVYPLAGNEAVIGLDFYSESAGNREAVMARELGELVLGGPFTSVQGEQILVGRLPVFLGGKDGQNIFWGLISVTLKYPQALSGAKLHELRLLGYDYEVWRINPDTDARQVIASSGSDFGRAVVYVDEEISFLNTKWHLRVFSTVPWYASPKFWTSVFIGLLFSILIAIISKNNQELLILKGKLEALSYTDALTGIHNRRFAEENIHRIEKSLLRCGETLSIILIDLDFFKEYNDTYGHGAGDVCLKKVAEALTGRLLRSDDFVARYGGEEFLVVMPYTDEKGADLIGDKLLDSVRALRIKHKKSKVADHVTISAGAVTVRPSRNDQAIEYIKCADEALYASKQNGRNRYTRKEFIYKSTVG